MSNITSIKQQAADNFAAQFPILVQRGIDEPTWNALCNTIYPGANPDSVVMAIDYCKARGLDILLKPVHLVPMQVTDARSKEKVWRDVPMPGIGMYRIQADRSGNYAGADEPVFGPDVTEEFQDPYNQSAKIKVTYPQWCKYTVFKMVNGQRVAFHALERWKENYATQSGKTECPNAMWRKRPYAQLAKCFDSETEVLTSEGFQRFAQVTGRILQVTDAGLEYTDAVPFVQSYDGPMVVADGTRLNFCVTPNHDMITNQGRVEAGLLYEQATTDSDKWSIPRTVLGNRGDAPFSDSLLALVGYLLADGSHTGYHQYRIAVSRPYKVLALDSLKLHMRKTIKRDAGRISGGDRPITTTSNKQSFTYDAALVNGIMCHDKSVSPEWALSLSVRQARIVVDALLEFDGSHNGSVRRLHQSNANVIKAFEVLAVQAGYSISVAAVQNSDLGQCSRFTLSETISSPVVKGVEKNRASLTIQPNIGGQVWCVTVPSGVIVVRRKGLSMLCGNCTEAQALRKAWPEIGSEPTAEEMEGKEIIINEIPGSQPQHGAPAKSRTLDAIRGQSTESVTLEHEQMAEPAQADHANAYADHCAAIEGACDTTEWQQAYTTAWTWANETGDQNIIAGIKQIAGERKKQLSAGNGAQQ